MFLLVLFGSLALLFISGIPIAFALFISSLIYLLLIGEYPLNIVAGKFISGPDSFTLLAIPLFVSAGALMNLTGVTRRIFGVARALVGHLAGGLGHVNIVASIIFSGMSGAAMADAAGLGIIEIKAMREAGYDDDFSVAVTASSSIIGPIIPPSMPAVIYGTVASVSVGGLFLGGIIPGLMMGLFLMALVVIYAKRRGYPRGKRVSLMELLRTLYEGFLPLMTPVIIIGGIWTGWFTPTEAAGAACVYAIFLGLCYRELTPQTFIEVLKQNVTVSGPALFILAASSLFNWIMAIEQIPQIAASFLLGITQNKYIILFIINIFLLVIGTFLPGDDSPHSDTGSPYDPFGGSSDPFRGCHDSQPHDRTADAACGTRLVRVGPHYTTTLRKSGPIRLGLHPSPDRCPVAHHVHPSIGPVYPEHDDQMTHQAPVKMMISTLRGQVCGPAQLGLLCL